MSFTKVANLDEIKNNEKKTIFIDDKEILIINYDNNYYAINRRCTHLKGDLSKGKVENGIITCPNHGSKFDLTNGKSISGPKIAFLKFNTKDLTTYEVKIEDEEIYIKI
ncbi:Rieske 2Fe-2S domain-containing protein [Candidatus Bathyarchaeota archaeon]|nr:Rieske 2Fe-2S domain-containing protein [Candidatus Bathyarchaeota archaeon]